MAALLDMGGYGAYVWPAYGISFLVLAGLGGAIWRRRKTLNAKLARLSENAAPAGEKAS